MKYVFDPLKYGYLPPSKMPKQLKEQLGKRSYVKVIAVTDDGSFWYESIVQEFSGDRWTASSGLYDAYREDNRPNHVDYCGCITSESYAEQLLIHLFGTTTDEGTLDWGKKRLFAKSLRIKRRKPVGQTATL